VNNYSKTINVFLGPFASTNYLVITDKVHWDQYIVTAGIQMGLRLNHGRFNYNIISFEIGYRNISGSSNYHLSGKLDILTLISIMILLAASTADNTKTDDVRY